MKTNRTDRYFACAPVAEIGESLMNRFYLESGPKTELAGMYATAYGHYYGHEMGKGVTHAIQRAGEQSELAAVRINKARAIAKSLHSLITGPQTSWRPQAASNDTGSKAATILAANLCEWYWKKRFVAQNASLMAETAIVFAEGFVFMPWDETIGPEVSVDTTASKLVRGGDLAYHNVLPWDVVRDSSAKSYGSGKWKGVRIWENKWDLIALTPKDVLGEDTREAILSAAKQDDVRELTPGFDGKESDLVPVWYFFHEPTPSLPAGLEVKLVSSKCVLRWRPMKYVSTPLVRFGLDELLGTPFGYTSHWDTLVVQELMDGVESAIATNLLTCGVQSIGIEQGTETPPENAYGMKEFVYPKGGQPPTPLQMAKSAPESYPYLKDKARDQMELLNLNAVSRGNPDTADMNAQAFMVLASKAVEQNLPGQKSFLGAVSEIGTKTLQTVSQRAKDERKVQIYGKGQRYLYTEKAFRGSDLKAVEGVIVEIGNPLEQTAAGRFQLATTHHEMGLIKTPEDLQQVLDTGRLDPAIQDMRDESMHIAAENEELALGKAPLCHQFHNHLRHAAKHAALTSNPEIMGNPKALEAIQAHVNEHYVEFFMLAPEQALDAVGNPIGEPMPPDPMSDPQYPIRIRMLLGQPPPPDMAPPMPVDGTQPPAPGQESASGPPNMAPPGDPTAGLPAMPQPPQGPPPMEGAPGGSPPLM
jgi:hypothetical protein